METQNPEWENTEVRPWGMDVNQFCMLMHLSQFAGYLMPFAGVALPIVMWATTKEESPQVDEQGKNILNWMISTYIYAIGFGILCIFLIGIPFIIALGIMTVVCAILGAIKSNDGGIYKYPFTINFIK
ncbi:DUF4870 domain-containing protein [Flammeovirga pacifica]|uniref:Orotate phosphoribosyltransferase n=1 Tax=Flammeovirga pacifica TaxID=915059 RepID=A0A1S1YTN7_FLAPC|nr:DUF4870 domain-containing protein [Flammeovirga pacifica]OHX64390.1 hypothetical protein NH26_22620 [Flammeovirga pacifica]